MYWVVLALTIFLESWLQWLLVWIPFYAWLRLGLHLWLVLPQTQGAKIIYQEHIHPFLANHEREIEEFISKAHERAKTAGWQYLKQAVELFKEHVLGLPPKQASPQPSYYPGGSYAQNLLARFNLPSARDTTLAAGGLGDFYGLLSSAVGQVTATNRSQDAQAADLSASGTLIPASIQGDSERISYIATQRERLSVLMKALDTEASNISSTSPGGTRSTTPRGQGTERDENSVGRSRSEVSFDRVERDEVEGDERPTRVRTKSGGWMPWNWKGAEGPSTAGKESEKAIASGTDIGK
jgi:receptor expression-enhancing protein 1/2/3/4